MGRLRLAALLFLAFHFSAPAPAAPLDRWEPHIAEASARFGIPAGWIRRVMAAESGGRTMLRGRPIESRAGAMGLMQLMPSTWSEVRSRLGLGSDPHDPRDNILAGSFYLREMYDRFGYPGLFAAYNAGPGRYSRHLASGRPLPAETLAYVRQVAAQGAEAVAPALPAASPPARPSLLVRLSGERGAEPDGYEASPMAGPSLFFRLGPRN